MQQLADESLARLKEAGIKRAQWLCSGLDDEPKRCRDAHEKIVMVSRLRRGDHGPRCRCSLIAISEPAELPLRKPVDDRQPRQTEEQRRKRILNDFTRPLW